MPRLCAVLMALLGVIIGATVDAASIKKRASQKNKISYHRRADAIYPVIWYGDNIDQNYSIRAFQVRTDNFQGQLALVYERIKSTRVYLEAYDQNGQQLRRRVLTSDAEVTQMKGVVFQIVGYGQRYYILCTSVNDFQVYEVTTRWNKAVPQVGWFLPQFHFTIQKTLGEESQILCGIPVEYSNYRPLSHNGSAYVYPTISATGQFGLLAYRVDKGTWVHTRYPKAVSFQGEFTQAGNSLYLVVHSGRTRHVLPFDLKTFKFGDLQEQRQPTKKTATHTKKVVQK